MPSLANFRIPLPKRWAAVFGQRKASSDTDNSNNGGGSSPISPSQECYACTQVVAPAFHSTTCDHAHSPHWSAGAGSSLLPVQGPVPKPIPRQHLRRPTSSLSVVTHGPFGRVLDPRSKRVQRLNRAFLIARGVALAIDPLFFYALSIGRSGQPCLFMDGGLAAFVTALRTCADAVHVAHMWLQFRLAYVSRESLVVGCGKLVWDAHAISDHYLRSLKGFWFDAFVILPVPQARPNIYTSPTGFHDPHLSHGTPNIVHKK